jgi:hypothetical protein
MAGELLVTSYTTRLMLFTALIMRVAMRARNARSNAARPHKIE